MNSFGDAPAGIPARDFFFITPGWKRLRLAGPLEAGVRYRNYVRMVPVEGETGAHVGDMYLLWDKTAVALCQGIKFKRVPRTLIPAMFPRRGSRGMKKNSGVHDPPPVRFTTRGDIPTARTPSVEVTPTAVVSETDPIATPPSSTASDQSSAAESRQQHPHVAASIQLIA